MLDNCVSTATAKNFSVTYGNNVVMYVLFEVKTVSGGSI